MPEYLVTMRPMDEYNFSVVILIEADNFNKCIEEAFYSRNIPSSWCISDIISDTGNVPEMKRDILYMDFISNI